MKGMNRIEWLLAMAPAVALACAAPAAFAEVASGSGQNSPDVICGALRLQPRAELLWTKPLCKEDGRYIGWPTVCRAANGDLLAVFSGDRDQHVCPWGKVQMVRSTDGGKTWSAPVNICNTIIDDRDAGIISLDDGSLLMSWFTSTAYAWRVRNRKQLKPGSPEFYWHLHDAKTRPEDMIAQLGAFVRRSTDGGKTWAPAVRTRCSAPHGPIQLRDGRVLYVGKEMEFENDKFGRIKPGTVIAAESTDRGTTWRTIGEIPFPKGMDVFRHCHEPHVVEAADGCLVTHIRCVEKEKGKDGKKRLIGARGVLQSESRDGGKTWTVAHDVGIKGYPAHLLRLNDGRLLTVYGRRWGDSGEYACLSDDNGRTWDVRNEIKLAGHWDGDIGYPASAQLPDGTILTVYYQAENKGEKPCLMGTLWRVR